MSTHRDVHTESQSHAEHGFSQQGKHLPRLTPKEVEESERMVDELGYLGWSKNQLEKKLGFPNGFLSHITAQELTRNPSRNVALPRLQQLREFYASPEEPPISKNRPGPVMVPVPEKMPVRQPVSNGVLDDLLYAERLRGELENALSRAESKALPLLRPGLRNAVDVIRRFKDTIRVG